VPAPPVGKLGDCLERWAKGTSKKTKKYNCVVPKVMNVHQTKVNRTHVHTVYETIEVLHYFRFAA